MRTEYKVFNETGVVTSTERFEEATREGWRPVCITSHEKSAGTYHMVFMKRTWFRRLLNR